MFWDYNQRETMRKFGAVLVLLSLLWLGGCGEKKSKENPAPSHPPTEANRSVPVKPAPKLPATRSFSIRDLDGRQTRLEFGKEKAVFHRIRQPIVMIVLFADWCPPCRGMLPYLGQLQTDNKESLFIIGVPVHSDLKNEKLRRFMLRYSINFFVSQHPDNDALGSYLAQRLELGSDYPLPLAVIYKNGKYVMHISGAAPYEMLQSIIEQLKDKKEKKER